MVPQFVYESESRAEAHDYGGQIRCDGTVDDCALKSFSKITRYRMCVLLGVHYGAGVNQCTAILALSL